MDGLFYFQFRCFPSFQRVQWFLARTTEDTEKTEYADRLRTCKPVVSNLVARYENSRLAYAINVEIR